MAGSCADRMGRMAIGKGILTDNDVQRTGWALTGAAMWFRIPPLAGSVRLATGCAGQEERHAGAKLKTGALRMRDGQAEDLRRRRCCWLVCGFVGGGEEGWTVSL